VHSITLMIVFIDFFRRLKDGETLTDDIALLYAVYDNN